MTTLFWFNQDLRIHNNSGFSAACKHAETTPSGNSKVIPLYILDENHKWQVQGAQRWWLHHSLKSLKTSLISLGGNLTLRCGEPLSIFEDIFEKHAVKAIYFARCYDSYHIELQSKLKALCDKNNIECKRFGGSLLQEPETVLNKQGLPFKVFTPYSRTFLAQLPAPKTARLPKNLKFARHKIESDKLDNWQLLPQSPNWAKHFPEYWQPGENAAQTQLKEAIQDIVTDYQNQRDTPSTRGTSRLSPYLHFGEISVAKIWQEITAAMDFDIAFPYLRQLIWREFSHSLIFHWPHIDEGPFRPEFAHFPWQENNTGLTAWQKGMTGYPIVDAGMRELWQSGWMHNRVRMICASFLCKHLRIHWLEGAKWFWDTLVDADLANNSAGWQWVAGSGADAAPYFRIFNPILQGEKFDPEGFYVRQWVPELRHLNKKYIHKPWLAPEDEKQKIEGSYPSPIVDHSSARVKALDAYKVCTASKAQS